MRATKSLLTWVAVGAALGISCYSPTMPEPKTEANPLDEVEGSDSDPVARNTPPPPENATDPDMAFLKDMARRGMEQALKCDSKEFAGPRGVATANVKFEPRGWTGDITVEPPHKGTPIGDCIKRAFEKLHGSRFEGEPVMIHQKVDFTKKKPDKKPDTEPTEDEKKESK